MAIFASSKGPGGDFELCPAGAQQLVCCDIVDHGNVRVTYSNKTRVQHKITIRWLSVEHKTKEGKPCLVQRRFTCSLHPQSALRKYLDGWRGVPFTEAEADKFDLETLIGVNGLGNVVHQSKPRGMFAEVLSLMPLPRGIAKVAVDPEYVRVCNRPPETTEQASEPPADYDDSVPEEPPF